MSTIKSIEITSNGTLTDFFAQLKEKILANTNFELVSEDTENFTLLFDTKISDMKLKIIDTYVTLNPAQTSSSIKCILLSENFGVTEAKQIQTMISYSSQSNAKETVFPRTLALLIYENDNFSMISLRPYNSSSWSFGYDICSIGKLTTKKVDDGSTVERVFFLNKAYDVNKNNSDLYIANAFYNIASSGVCYVNQMLTTQASGNSLSGKVMEYCENLYNCTNLTSGYKYNINGKTFFAIDSNILVEE